MITVPLHPRERARLTALADLRILDTPDEERFDRITRLAAHLLDVPVSLVSLVDQDRQWFKSRVGLDGHETPRDVAFCAHAVADPNCAQLVVPDALADDRFSHNPLVVENPSIRAYAGQVVHAPDGMPVGTLCVIDTAPRQFTEAQLAALADLGAMVEDELARSDEARLHRRLDESERSKTVLLDTLDQGLLLFSADGRVIQANCGATAILGLGRDELLSGHASDQDWAIVRVDGSNWPESEQPVTTVFRTGRPVVDQTMGVTVDGTRRWLRMSARPVIDTEGAIESVAAVFSDITDELRVRADAAAQAERLRGAIDDSPVGTGLTDEVGNFTYLNPAYAELIGIDPAEASGRTSLEFILAEDLPEVAERFRDIAHGNVRQFTHDLRIRDTSGEIKFVRAHVARLEPATPTAAYLVQVEDITSRRRLTDAVRRAEELARASLEGLEEGVMLFDEHLRVLRINGAGEAILGTDAETLTRMLRSGEVTAWNKDGSPVAAADRAVGRSLVNGETVHGHVVRWIGNDRDLLARISSVPVTLDDGRRGAVVSFEDVTERREMELAVERYRILFRHATDMISVIDEHGRLQYSSPSAQRILGWGEHWSDPAGVLTLVHPEDLASASEELAALISGQREHDPVTLRVRTATGDWRHLEIVGVNLLHEPSIRGVVITGRDVTERQQLLDALEHQAAHDQLTGLPNRAFFGTQLTSALARAAREKRHVALCYVDLDRFKLVNDLLGHATGDEVLVTVADRIRSTVRAGDTPARLGGDEFVVLLDPVHDADHGAQVAERLRDAILGDRLGPDPAPVGASVGIAISRFDDTPSDLLARADTALYSSKARGRGSVVAASP